jgi:hypothetical protein
VRITIVPEDKTVVVDGVSASEIDMSGIDEHIHAVQWREDSGEIEWKESSPHGLHNEKIFSFERFEFILDLYQQKISEPPKRIKIEDLG